MKSKLLTTSKRAKVVNMRLSQKKTEPVVYMLQGRACDILVSELDNPGEEDKDYYHTLEQFQDFELKKLDDIMFSSDDQTVELNPDSGMAEGIITWPEDMPEVVTKGIEALMLYDIEHVSQITEDSPCTVVPAAGVSN
eukprot:46289_1